MKPHFTGRFINEQIGHQWWRVHEGFSFTNSFGITTVVEEGFEHDFGSIPQVVQIVIPKVGYWNPACVVHDKQHRLHREGEEVSRTRWRSNADLLEGMRAMAKVWDVPDSKKRHLFIYGGVMAAGPGFWETPAEKKDRIEMLNSHITDE